MKSRWLLHLLVATLGVLWAGTALADSCLGGGGGGGGGYYPTADVTATEVGADGTADGDTAKAERTEPRMLGAAFLLAACVSTGWLVLRKKD